MGIVLGHHIGDPAISLQATPVTLMSMIETPFHDDPIHQVNEEQIDIEHFIDEEPDFVVNGEHIEYFTEEKPKFDDWEHRNILERHRMKPSRGFLQSTFIANLKSVSEKSDLIRKKAHETIKTAKEKFDINIEKNANMLRAKQGAQRLERMLSTICEYKRDVSNIVREKRFVGALFLFLFVTITSYGIAAAVASSSRVINIEDVELAQDAAEEKLALNEIEIKRLEKNSGSIEETDLRVDTLEHKIALDNYGRYLEHSATSAIRELSYYLNPNLWNYEESPFLERMAMEIRIFYASRSDDDEDIFQNVIGNGISEVLYLTSFEKAILQEEQNNDCKDASVMLVATTIHPMTEISGTKTEIYQQYKTDVGNQFFYINEKYIAKGTNFRPEESLAAQRLVMTSSSITATVLNNTVFQIHSSTPLKANITCPNTTKTVTLFNSPMIKLNTSCTITSPHLNISSFYQEYQEDIIAEKFGLFDKSDDDLEFLIGYHRKPLSNTNDISEMHKMAHEIFVKETQITQNEMEALENDPSLGKMITDAGNAFVGWFNEQLHNVVVVIMTIVGSVLFVIFIIYMVKCCCCK